MEAQRQLMHVHEGLVGELAHRILPDACKQGVAQLVEPPLRQPGDIIGQHQHHRRQKRCRDVTRCIELIVERIRRQLEGIRHAQKHDLRQNQKQRGHANPTLQIRPVRWPDIGPQIADRFERIARISGNKFLLFGQVACLSRADDDRLAQEGRWADCGSLMTPVMQVKPGRSIIVTDPPPGSTLPILNRA